MLSRRLSVPLLLATLAACAPDRELPGEGPNGCENAGTRPLNEIYDRYFDDRAPTGCSTSGCHGTGAGGLTFTNAAEFRAATVGRPSLGRPDMNLVTPGDVANSYLYWRMHPTDPRPMPQGGPYLDDIALAEVAAWICAGAPGPEPIVDGPDGGTDGGTDGGDCCTAGPVLTTFEPTAGVVGTPVVLTGAGFSPIAGENSVTFNGVEAFVETSTVTSITTSVPAGATTGPVRVTVAGLAATSATVFQVIQPNPVPQLTNVAPSTLLAGTHDTTLTLTGADFVERSTAEWDGVALATTFVGATGLTALVPAARLATAGDHTLTVTTPGPGGGTTSAVVVHVENPAPHITGLTPARTVAGSADLDVQVAGTGFVAATQVTLNGAPATTTITNAQSLSVRVPATLLATAGSIAVAVTTPAPGGGTSTPTTLPVENPTPVLSVITPVSVLAGSGAATLTLDGTGFVGNSTVKLDGAVLVTTFVGATRLNANVPASSTASGGAHALTVSNPIPGGGTSANVTWTVNNPAPGISGLSPASVATNGAPFTLTVTGTGFVSASVVSFDGAAVPTTFVSTTTLEAALPTIGAPGSYPVTVTNPAPGGGTSTAATLTASTSNAPTITGLAPGTVEADTAFTLTVSGSGYVCSPPASRSVVLFNGSTSTPSTCTSTQLTVALPAVPAGGYPVAVRNGSGLTSDAMTLSAVAPNPVPTLSALSPSSGATGGAGFTLTADGTGFVAGAVLSFNGVDRPTTLVDPTRVTASIPSSDLSATGSFPVVVTNPVPGGGASNTRTFAVVQPNPIPAITGLSPSSVGEGSGATTVTVSGTGFATGVEATFDGATRTTTRVSTTELTIALTAADTQAAGTYTLVVTNPAPGGGDSGGFTFTVVALNPVPVATSLSPASATAGGGTFTLTVDGSGFVSPSVVTFNGNAKPTTVVSATRLTASIAAADLASAGSVDVRVTSPAPGGGTSGALPFAINNPAPVVSSISPSTVTVGASAVAITVNGSGFVSSSVVRVDGTARTTRLINSTQLSADIVAGDVASVGTHTLTVFNPTPGGGTSAGATLTIASQPNPVPVVTTLSPCGKVAGTGAFTLTITGSNFVDGATARFNGTDVTVTFVNGTTLTAAIPASAIATAPANNAAAVVVTNPAPGGGAAGTVYFGVAKNPSTLAANVQPILLQSCATTQCHKGSSPEAFLNLESGRSYAELVGVNSIQCTSRKLVLACGPLPSQSYLIAKLLDVDTCDGTRMPRAAPLSQAEKQTVIDWVAQGAPQ